MNKKDRRKRLRGNIPLRSVLPEVYTRARDEVIAESSAEIALLRKEYDELCKTPITLSDLAALAPDKECVFTSNYREEKGVGVKLFCSTHFELDANALTGDNNVLKTLARTQEILTRIDKLRNRVCYTQVNDKFFTAMHVWLVDNPTCTHEECKAKIIFVTEALESQCGDFPCSRWGTLFESQWWRQ